MGWYKASLWELDSHQIDRTDLRQHMGDLDRFPWGIEGREFVGIEKDGVSARSGSRRRCCRRAVLLGVGRAEAEFLDATHGDRWGYCAPEDSDRIVV